MNDPVTLVATVIATMVVSWVLVLVGRPALRRFGIIDLPNARSSHSSPTLRGGGIAPMISLVAGGAAATLVADLGDVVAVLVTCIGAGAVAGVLGLVEDVKGLPVTFRAAAQLTVGLVTSMILVLLFGHPAWLAVLAAIAIAGYINVANFMDGINGISAIHALIVGATYATIGVVLDLSWLAWTGALIAAAFLPFLYWNLRPPGVFLGDVGSYTLGASVAATGVAAFFAGAPLIMVVAPLTVYLADVFVTLIRRVLKGERWFEAHRTHVYQRLASTPRRHVPVALLVGAFSAASAACALLAVTWGADVWGWVAIIALGGIYLLLPKARERMGARV